MTLVEPDHGALMDIQHIQDMGSKLVSFYIALHSRKVDIVPDNILGLEK